MSITSSKHYPIKFLPSPALSGLTTFLTNDIITVINTAVQISPARNNLQFYVRKGFQLNYFVNLATTYITIYDGEGNPLIPAALNAITTPASLYLLQDDSTYNLEVYNTVSSTAAQLLVTLSGTLAPAISNFFSQGIVPTNELPAAIPVTFSAFGAMTLTFTNYPVTNGSTIFAAIAEIANNSGTLTVTSSDATVYTSYSQAFSVNNSIAIVLYANKSTSFTGTVVISVTGLGVSAAINLASFSFNPLDLSPLIGAFSAFSAPAIMAEPMLMAMAAPAKEQIIAGLVGAKSTSVPKMELINSEEYEMDSQVYTPPPKRSKYIS